MCEMGTWALKKLAIFIIILSSPLIILGIGILIEKVSENK